MKSLFIKGSTLLLILLGIRLSAMAQTDTEFWFVAPEVYGATNIPNRPEEGAPHGDSPIYLRVSGTGKPTKVTVSQPANPAFNPYTLNIVADETQTINLTPQISRIENWPPATILPYGIHLTSEEPIRAYYEESSGNNPEIFPLLGSNALGTEFYIPGQTSFANNRGSQAFDIVATEDSTIITILPTRNVRIPTNLSNDSYYEAGIPFVIVLNKGETFSARAMRGTGIASLNNKLTGTKVTSNKPIAITISDDSIFTGVNSPGSGSFDLIGKQIIPTRLLGTEYIAIRGELDPNRERVYVTATRNDTKVFVSDTLNLVATLKEGQTAEIRFPPTNTSLYIRTSYPAYAYQLTGSGSEAADAILPAIQTKKEKQTCGTGVTSQSFVRTSNSSFIMMLLTELQHKDSFLLNGQPDLITGAMFSPVAGAEGWVAARITTLSSIITAGATTNISNKSGSFHLAFVNRLGSSAVCGFFSDYSQFLQQQNLYVAVGDSIPILGGTGKRGEKYLWLLSGDTTRKIVITDKSQTDNGKVYLQFTNVAGCTQTDTFTVNFIPLPLLGEQVKDTAICMDNQLLTLHAAHPSHNTNTDYEWRFLNSLPNIITNRDSVQIDVSTPGTYYFRIKITDKSNSAFATTIDTIKVTVGEYPASILPKTKEACSYSVPITLNGFSSSQYAYLWDGVTHNSAINVSSSGKYVLKTTDTTTKAACSIFDTIDFRVNTPPALFLGNDTLLDRSFTKYLLNAEVPTQIGKVKYLWNTGEQTAKINVSLDYYNDTSVVYAVTLTDTSRSTNCISSDTITLNIYADPLIKTIPDTALCSYYIPFQLDAYLPAHSLRNTTYKWNTGETTPQIAVNAAGKYIVAVTDNDLVPAQTSYDTMELVVYTAPAIAIKNSRYQNTADAIGICKGEEVIFDVPAFAKYEWSTGDTSQSIVANKIGTYHLQVTDTNGCIATDKVSIDTIFDLPFINFADTLIPTCEDGAFTISSENTFVKYLWNDNSTLPTLSVTENGMYWLQVTDYNRCVAADTTQIFFSCKTDIQFPTAFTPNGDGINDRFMPLGKNILSYKLNIYNRWGELVHTSDETQQGWDGTFRGQSVPSGGYYFTIEYEVADGITTKQKESTGVIYVVGASK
jgi:gliding motility-associated-like protein